MQLTQIQKIIGTIVLQSGLHIGAGDSEMRIGGTDSPVVKDPLTGQPYIPGSSLKGKIRSLLEWRHGLVLAAEGKPYSFKQLAKDENNSAGRDVIKLFGGAPDNAEEKLVNSIGPTRLAFWDCPLSNDWKIEEVDSRNLLITEVKSENSIKRIAGTAESPRFIERVIAGARFDFTLTLKVLAGDDLLDTVLLGLRLLELDSLGGSGSRGYGKIKFAALKLDGTDLMEQFRAITPFNQTA
ncbi:CRISPR-associated protein, Csm3 family [Nitrosomonas eutropha]|uniref:type III-A CRISPR-associated RAMP protein Csm3 n=1 Tax=Nitrosomonas TaxID=914 RepID=UPI00089B728D|nr:MULTISPECIES: type III-A CRISPR-associated RAMP protein Csm3 [Nitrosomonas]MXS79540.1 type III-A CRISPR-associated RAMP protein Csm3 [Nitrosomonas sp. GH22]SDX05915.1 CRISPR-associated protein, Csm3 family [Nitrosomonas eutropha]